MRWVGWIGLALLIGLGVGSLLVYRWTVTPLALDGEGHILQVKDGESLRQVSRGLAREGLLTQPRMLDFLGRLTGADQRIRAGEYRLVAGFRPADVLHLLESGDTVRYLVTLPEGIRLAEALVLLQNTDGIEPVLVGVDDPRLLAMVAPRPSPEGYFLPETYQYQRGDSDLSVLSQAHALMRQALAAAWAQRDSDLPYTEPYEVIIMASLIEKETGLAREREQIGGVFIRRLQQGMRLQTDPSVIYGLGVDYDGDLRRSHLRDENNPYNSYRHHGLPPGPIALPGRDALLAAVHPAAGDALYFVARGDGSHEFNAELAGHEAAVKRYQLLRRADYRSAPNSTSAPAVTPAPAEAEDAASGAPQAAVTEPESPPPTRRKML